jgi:hypothetical protein
VANRALTISGLLMGLSFGSALLVQAQSHGSSVKDPGPRSDEVDAGGPLSTLSAAQLQFFQDGMSRFMQVDSVTGTIAGEPGLGLGPGFNSNSCASCHAQPAVGGSSPNQNAYPNIGQNPQIAAGTDAGATNSMPYFVSADGPVREARCPRVINANGSLSQTPDGGVHDLFTIAGRSDAGSCGMQQPNFEQMRQLNDIIFRIPTPV